MPTDPCIEPQAVDTSPLPLLSSQDIARLADTFKLLGDPSRLRILLQCLTQPAAVNDIAESLQLSQSLVSHHLRLLKAARLVIGERHARHVYYRVADNHVRHVLLDMAIHLTEESVHD
ncbi:ArsR/SmtB family transcription factor [Rosenbergiella australiborealis]|uniref:ArsR/SmtB family transcription factor n=1 Tax=Rosenbergiella australiborealis TaxID=1544696 RepID=UPI001F4DC2FA|nr:metalloregulator ArsR/SmtB family transcription factor [Rosenbergiella australiborealis]